MLASLWTAWTARRGPGRRNLPAVAIDQKNAIKSSRSTVGTASELADFLKVLMGMRPRSIAATHLLKKTHRKCETGTQ